MSIRILGKLRNRSLSELRERSGQAVARWLERRGLGASGEPTGEELVRLIGPDSSLPVMQGPFFASVADRAATMAALRTVDPRYEESLRLRADRIIAGRYDLLGHQDLSFGDPVDWSLEPVSGVRAPRGHWSAIAFLDPKVAGDHKVVWELSRHHGLVTLAQAWWVTRDDRYAVACAVLLESWLDANRPKDGIHWASSLEVAFRAMSWTWMLALAGEALPRALQRRALAHLALSGAHVERYMSTWFSPNTHLTGEALGLFTIGTSFPQLRDAARWREVGARILLDWVDRHVRPDGTYVEQSTWYHRYTTDFYIHFLALAERSGMEVRARVGAPLERLLDVLQWVARPDGHVPLIGDDDGGRLAFLDGEPAAVVSGTLATGAAMFGRGDLAHAASRPTPELVWLLGPAGLDAWRGLGATPPSSTARAFPDGGLYVGRSDWGASASVMTIDAGPHGFMNAGHAHADALSLDLTLKGVPCLVDPGTFTYTTSPRWRDAFRATSAHNAATVDGCGSATMAGAFSWASRAESRCDAWYAGGPVLFSGTHNGFARLAPPIAYRRTVVFLPPSIWIVRDEIHGEEDHELAVHWQCAPGFTVSAGADGAILQHPSGLVVRLTALEGAGMVVDEGSVSPAYGLRVPSARLTSRARGVGGERLTTVISENATVAAQPAFDGKGLAVTAPARSGVLLFGGGSLAGVDTDALVAWVELTKEESLVAVAVAGATRASVRGQPLVIQNGAASWSSRSEVAVR